jgi:hypothetical protein
LQPPDVDLLEQKQIEAKGFKGFLSAPDEAGLRWIRRKKDGSCFFLENNKCAIYDFRPAVCRLEPFTIVDYNYPEKYIELDLNFPYCCACVGVSSDGCVSLQEVEKAALVVMCKVLALTARDLDLSISDRRVAAEARARILRMHVELADFRV